MGEGGNDRNAQNIRLYCDPYNQVRAMCYNDRTQEIAVISLNSFIHCWNAVTMKQVRLLGSDRARQNLRRLPDIQLNVYYES